MDLDNAVLELYSLPPEEFTPARNELARRARDAGNVNAGVAIKALKKPTLAAWLANQLVRTEPDRVDDLTRLGDELRQAHMSQDGARLRELTPRRRDLVRDLVYAARVLAGNEGRKVTADVAERLAETLDAAMVDPGAAQLLRSGRLTSALRHVGFGVVDEAGQPAAAIVPVVAPTPTTGRAARKVTRQPDKRAAARRRKQLQTQAVNADAELREAEAELARVQAELDANEHHIQDMQTAIERLTEELQAARQELRQAQSRATRLERDVTTAGRAAIVARRHRDDLHSQLEKRSLG